MDKTLLKAYIRTVVEEEVNRILPKLLSEAVSEIKQISEQSVTKPRVQASIDRSKLAAMMGLERLGDTIVATTNNVVMPQPPQGIKEDNPAFQAINKDYSELMKKMGLSK